MTEAAREALVIGLGNPLMGDDGTGLAALELLRREWVVPTGVELLDGGTWGMNLLPRLEDTDHVVLLDAIRTGAPPGTLVELEGPAVPRALHHKLSPHQIDLGEVLAVASLRGTLPRTLVVVGIEPAVIEMQTTLSPVVEAALPALVDRVVARLAVAGLGCVRREAVASCTS